MLEPLYAVKLECILCKTSFQTMKVRSSYKKTSRIDTDFCPHYNDINPEFYIVRVCPFCGFSTTENFSEKISENHKKMYAQKVMAQWQGSDYGKERDWEEALHAYKLALICAQIKEESNRVIASILHHLAWMYRYKGMEEQEKRFLQYSLDAYIRVYETEGVDNNAKLMYLIGELSTRLGLYAEGVKWFSRVVNDKSIIDAAMIRACREQWGVARELMQQDLSESASKP